MNLWIQPTISLRRGFPIRTSADQRSLASPRGFSQRATSFIASWRQGIHRTPFSCSLTSSTARAQDQAAPGDRSPPLARPSARPAPSLRLPQPTSHTFSDGPSHPAARVVTRAARADISIRQIRFTISKNTPDTAANATGRNLSREGSRGTKARRPSTCLAWRLADSNR